MTRIIIIAITGLALCLCSPMNAAASPDTPSGAASPPSSFPAAQPPASEALDDSLQGALASVQKSSARLEQLRDKFERASDERKVLLAPELAEVRTAYLHELNAVAARVSASDPADTPDQRALATATISPSLDKEGDLLLRDLDHEISHINSLLTPDTAAPAERDDIDTVRRASLALMPVLLTEADLNLKARASLGTDVTSASKRLAELASRSATLADSILHTVAALLDKLRPTAKGELSDEDQARRERLLGYRKLVAALQHANLDMMDDHGLDTVRQRQNLIRTTGQVSQDILNAEVASGLLGKWADDAISWGSERAPGFVFKVISLVLIVLLFAALGRLTRTLAQRTLGSSQRISSLAADFFVKLSGRGVFVVGLLIAAATVGVEVGPVLAGLGIAGFVIGFALQETLSNFAAGLMILVYRPFDVGDVIEAAGVTGSVQAMTLVSTSVVTFDNQMLIVPNSKIWGGVIRNVTHQATRRVDLTFNIGYADDADHAQAVLEEILRQHSKVLANPAPVVRLHELGESSVSFVVRPWAKTADYWDVYWGVTRDVKRRFDGEGITFPCPQRDVHVYQESAPRSAMRSDVVPMKQA